MPRKYEMIYFRSEADNADVAGVSALPGCTADGNTYQEARSNAEVRRIAVPDGEGDAGTQWIETALALGRPIPRPRGRLAYA